MTRRSLFFLLLACAFVLLGVAFWVARPLWTTQTSRRELGQQPPALPETVIPSPAQPGELSGEPQRLSSPLRGDLPSAAGDRERVAQETLMRLAMNIVSRSGSFSSVDEFHAITDVFPMVTTGVRAYLSGVRNKLIAEHPASGPSWGQTARALAPRLTDGIPLSDALFAEVTVQVRQTIETSGRADAFNQQAIVSFAKQADGTWLADKITWQPIP